MTNKKIPEHVCLIPDGNRRWAKENGLVDSEGHVRAGSYENIKSLVDEAKDLGVKYLSMWAFSTENWKRSIAERKILFSVILKLVKSFREDALREKVRFRHIGRKDRLPSDLIKEIENLENETSDFSDFNVQLFLDYGGRDEMIRAFGKLLERGKSDVSEEDVLECLDTYGIPEPDLIIRTSGEQRTSGFLPFLGTYSEWVFSDLYFPDFKAVDLRKAIEDFSVRGRRFGGD
tara:strand:+ start:2186 stop:2881 length:696 start_codon:yes stop_codon:yes gene_type:complete